MLADCGAVTFAPNDVSANALSALATKLGFGRVANYTQFAELPKDRLTFFLVHGQLPDGSKQRIIHGLRGSDHIFRRFAPIVCFVTAGPRHQIVPLVQMGFDEVLFVSDGYEDMSHKLAEQLQHEMLYVQSEHYFGPDRRRIERVDPQDPRRKPGGASYRKIRVVRDPRLGISTMDMA
jgi:hypothetical protein